MKYFLLLLVLMLVGCGSEPGAPKPCTESVIRPEVSQNPISCPRDTILVNDKQPGYFLCKCKTPEAQPIGTPQ